MGPAYFHSHSIRQFITCDSIDDVSVHRPTKWFTPRINSRTSSLLRLVASFHGFVIRCYLPNMILDHSWPLPFSRPARARLWPSPFCVFRHVKLTCSDITEILFKAMINSLTHKPTISYKLSVIYAFVCIACSCQQCSIKTLITEFLEMQASMSIYSL